MDGSTWCRPRRSASLIDAVTPLQARVALDQLEGTLTARLREMDAALLDLIAPLEASLDFPDEGYHFITPDDTARALGRGCARRSTRCWRDAARGKLIREGLTVAIVGRPNAGKVEPLQPARRRGARDRDGRAGHDARSA